MSTQDIFHARTSPGQPISPPDPRMCAKLPTDELCQRVSDRLLKTFSRHANETPAKYALHLYRSLSTTPVIDRNDRFVEILHTLDATVRMAYAHGYGDQAKFFQASRQIFLAKVFDRAIASREFGERSRRRILLDWKMWIERRLVVDHSDSDFWSHWSNRFGNELYEAILRHESNPPS